MAVIQSPWNQYEIALLIDTYLRIKDGKISHKDGIAQLSKRLRARVISQGGVISEQYRNENGMHLQMAAIAYLLSDGQEGKSGASKAFNQAVIEYHLDPSKHLHTLFLAERLYPVPVVPSSNRPTLEPKNPTIVAEQPITYRTVGTKEIRKILEEKFTKSFRLNSSIEIRRFRKFYEEIFGKPLNADDDELIETIKDCGIVNDDKVYLPENVLSVENKKKLYEYIGQIFSNGGTFIYYTALLEQLHDMFLDSLITDRQSLRTYMQYFDDNGWFYSTFYVATSPDIEPNLDKYVFDFLKYEGDAVEDDRVCQAIPYNTTDQVRRVLNYNPNTIITTGREGKHFHIDNFAITLQEKQGVSEIIDKLLKTSAYTTYDELSEHIRLNYPNVIYDNEHFSEIGIRNALKAMFSHRYQFENNIISKKGDSFAANDIFSNYCKSHPQFTINEMENLASEFKTYIPFEVLLEHSIRINHDVFISKSSVNFDVLATDNAINELVKGDYQCIVSFDNFTIFPDCGFPWNEYLLESYVMTRSIKFQLWHNRFLKDIVTGAIVRKNTKLAGFEELMIDAVAKSRISLNESDILNFLQENRLIARRRKGIITDLSIIEKATKIRNIN